MNKEIFSGDEWLRYSRHIQLPKFGAEGQKKLKQSHVLVVGAGGLGSPVLLYLAAAGVGEITIFDGDEVDATNLQRQIIFNSDNLGLSKAQCAKERLQAINPHIEITAVADFFSLENSTSAVANADIVLDCTDNFAARYLINDRCAEQKTPWVFASIYQFSGQCSLFVPGEMCFRCLFPEAATEAQDCNEAGVVGVLPGILGTIQATEAIKYLVGLPTPLKNHLLLFDAMNYSSRKIELEQSSDCVVCIEHKKPEQLTDFYADSCVTEAGDQHSISAEMLKSQLAEVRLIDVRGLSEREAFHIGGVHIPVDSPENQWDIATDKKVVCYCQTGKRSQRAAEKLRALGVDAISLGGGLAAWLKATS